MDRQRFQLPGERRGDVHKLAFDVALESVSCRIGATVEQEEQDQRSSDVKGLSTWPNERHFHFLRPFPVSAPSRTISRIPAKPSFGIIPSSSIFGGFMIPWTMASKISIMSFTETSLRTIPVR